MTTEKAFDIINRTIEMSLRYYPNDDWQPIVSIRRQLNYIKDALEYKNDRSRLKDINIGGYAVREFENLYEDLADIIYEVCDIVRLMIKNKL